MTHPLDELSKLIFIPIFSICLTLIGTHYYFIEVEKKVKIQAIEFQKQGYSKQDAYHKASVELELIPKDDKYKLIINN